MTGTIINYYIHCKRQCYLHYHKLNLEDNSELVKIGKALHEEKQTEEIAIENIKIDKINRDYLVEIKKSDADIEASKYQLYYYLKVLKDKGIVKKGKLEVIEKNKKDKGSRKIYILELTENVEKELDELMEKIKWLVDAEKVPEVEKTSKCKKCAYYSYCYI